MARDFSDLFQKVKEEEAEQAVESDKERFSKRTKVGLMASDLIPLPEGVEGKTAKALMKELSKKKDNRKPNDNETQAVIALGRMIAEEAIANAVREENSRGGIGETGPVTEGDGEDNPNLDDESVQLDDVSGEEEVQEVDETTEALLINAINSLQGIYREVFWRSPDPYPISPEDVRSILEPINQLEERVYGGPSAGGKDK